MTANISFTEIRESATKTVSRALFFSALVANAHGAATPLATEPFAAANKITALPNIMFVLDDSGSMRGNFLPDWAGPYLAADNITVLTPPHRFFNGGYNGVAYNPGTRYQPPVMYAASGALDTTTYPSQTGLSVAEGADASAKPNWKAVKVDGYGVQSAAIANLEGNAFSYTTVPGEYCTSAQLRTCTASATPTGSYTFPANLRWCTTSAMALDTTANAGTFCQASNINTTASGVTNYTFARMPRPRTSTITVGVAGTVNGITVDTQQILSAPSVTGSTSTDVATAIAASINACTFVKTGTVCSVVGYSATSSANVVTITAPGATTSTPVITVGTATASASAFTGGNVPGASLLTVITPTVTSYPYPGTAAKGSNRTDCAGTTCTYAEEMTNYANWYTYYRTRMQMMKTASSIAFSGVDDKFRVGYYSINNGTGSDFLNVSAFDGAQKNLWYTKFFSAIPYGATPLRTGLANTGRMYAGKLSVLNTVAVDDPMQYSCQQNYTILSTDGYWNDAISPKRIDGTTDIGNQDNNLDRPYYDGGTWTKTVSQTEQSFQQKMMNTFFVESKTSQLKTNTSRLSQVITTTTTQPWKKENSQLQTQTKPLRQSTYALESRTYPLEATTKQLRENIFNPESTTRPLERYTYNLTETTIPLQQTETKLRVRTYPLQVGTETVTSTTYKLQVGTETVTSTVSKLQVGTETVTSITSPLEVGTETVTSVTSPLQKSTYKLQSVNFQLQKRAQVSTDGGDTYQDTGWVDVTSGSCTTYVGVKGDPEKNVQCQYSATGTTSNLASCTTVAQSTSSPYTVRTANTCSYQSATVTSVATCAATAISGSSPYAEYATCAYGAAGAVQTVSSCTARDQGASPTSGDKVVCGYNSKTWATATGTPVACTPAAPANYGGSRITCRYGTAGSVQTVSSCTARDQALTSPMTGNKVVCGYNTVAWANATGTPVTCTANTPASYGGSRITCRYNPTAEATQTVSSCTARDQGANPTSQDKVVCGYNTVAWANATGTPVTCTANTPASYGGSRITCRYNPTAETPQTVSSCTARDEGANPTSQDKVVCGYNTVAWANATGTPVACNPNTPANYGGSRITCRYDSATSSDLRNRTSCTPNFQSTASAMTGDRVRCTYDSSTTTTVTSCIWNESATLETSRITCAYTGTPTTATVTTCSPVLPTGTSPPVPANTTQWNGPQKTCAWNAAVVATGLTSCSPTGNNAGPPFNTYTTCGYGTGVVSTVATSCTVDAPEAGPSYSNGQTVACAYPGTPTSSTVPVSGTCTWVAASATFATPLKTCTYDAATTATVSSCTNSNESTGGSGTYTGPARSCAYSTTASATNLNAGSCTASRQTASPFTAATAVDCAFNATPTTTTVTSCTTRNEAGPAYTGAKTVCAYDAAFGAWTDVTSGSCTAADQTAATGPTYAEWRACRYDPRADTYAGTCTGVTASPGPTNYTVRNPVVCVPGSYVTSTVTAAATTVDACTVGTATTGDVNGSPPSTQVDVATACTYAATPTVADATSCVEHVRDAGAAKATEVLCSSTTGPWVKATTTAACVPVGTQPPPSPLLPADFVGGKNIECKITEPATGTGTFASPVADPSCTPGPVYIDGANVQTNCVLSINTTPTPVDPTTCTATVGLPSGPDYIKQICTTTAPSSHVMGCSAQSPSAPSWQTITCVDDGNGTSDTLADVAAYYYYSDLRTPALGNCTGAIVSPATSGTTLCTVANPMNNVFTTASDPNAAQHMTTFSLGLGASGFMKFSDTYATDTSGDYSTVLGNPPHTAADGIAANPGAGVCSWQATGNCNWPFPVSDDQTTIDDLWHAGVNGHGAYFSATDPKTLSTSIVNALEKVKAGGGAGAAPTVSNPNLPLTDSFVFSATYKTLEWSGDVKRKQLSPYTGVTSPTIDWSAQGKLNLKSPATRAIYAFDSSVATTKLKAFTSANFASNAYFLSPHISTVATGGLSQFLCATTDNCLTATDQDSSHASGANLVNFLRGERTNEGAADDNTKYYRQRAHVLGDIVNAQLAYVSKPRFDFADPGYSAFVAAQATRQPVVYAAANDGMLHAFAAKGTAATEALVTASANAASIAFLDQGDAGKAAAAATAAAAAVAAVGADTTIGQELWAYIPTMVMPKLYKLADKLYKDKHRSYVDATPTVSDICVSSCTLPGAVWKTVLVGGLGRGGRGYYALDITDPANPKAMWEFSDTNMGYTYGTPQIAKMSDGTWVVMVTSGYNNIPNDDGSGGDGVGRLYVLNAATGAQISGVSPISTGAGSTTDPSGLAQITAQVINPVSDSTVEAVYGGDMLGNLWRFDINNTIGAAGVDAQLLAIFKDGSGKAQSITAKPQVSAIPKVNAKIVFVGTGRFLAASDLSDTSQQTLYAIKDVRDPGSTPATAIFDNPGGAPRTAGKSALSFVNQSLTLVSCPANSAPNICAPGEMVFQSANNPVNYLTDAGWFVDLIINAERANTNPALDQSLVVYNTNAPSLAACDIGGKSYQYWFNYLSGAAVTAPGTNGIVGRLLMNSFASDPTLMMTPYGTTILSGCIGSECQQTTKPPPDPDSTPLRRTSWRELIRE